MPEPVAPGVAFEVVPPPAPVEALRTDVAAFVGTTRRGPLGRAVRVAEWRDYVATFGALHGEGLTPFAVHSYFANGGQVAWVVRLSGVATAAATGVWPPPGTSPLPGHLRPDGGSRAFLAGGQAVTRFEVSAASPGAWAEGARVDFHYRLRGPSGGPEVDVEVRAAGEAPEVLRGLPAGDAVELANRISAASRLIGVAADLAPANLVPPAAVPGPGRGEWTVVLAGAAETPPDGDDYLAAVELSGRQREIALTAFPDLYRHLSHDASPGAPPAAGTAFQVLKAAITDADRRHDRMVLVDLPDDRNLPGPPLGSEEVERLRRRFADVLSDGEGRAAALYHPWLSIAGPLTGLERPRRWLPPSGPVAGLISRLDRQRGAHHTPANAALRDAADAGASFSPQEQARLNDGGVDLVRCFPNRGLVVWGGRTLGRGAGERFIAHRRLVHRLVRAVRRVAEPLVFETHGPETWLTLVRAISTVLLEAFRAGALQGARPEEAFRVRCDEETNPPEERDLGRLVCEIDVAPATPMEFITLRVALGREGELEVFER